MIPYRKDAKDWFIYFDLLSFGWVFYLFISVRRALSLIALGSSIFAFAYIALHQPFGLMLDPGVSIHDGPIFLLLTRFS